MFIHLQMSSSIWVGKLLKSLTRIKSCKSSQYSKFLVYGH
uniref:Uncharacterized protein n=1 Tax=Rhizophora mucronata TaxID=61149 RepID=A0A2P2IUJ2_RHIMU